MRKAKFQLVGSTLITINDRNHFRNILTHCSLFLELQGEKDIEMDMLDKQGEDYVPPPPPAYVAFSGSGATVGAVTLSAAAVVVNPNLGPTPHPTVDETKPVTTIQIRTLTGQRLRIR